MLKVQISAEGNSFFEFCESAEDFFLEDFSDAENFFGEIKITGEIVNDGTGFLVRGKIFCQRNFVCDRCLSTANETQVHEFSEELEKSAAINNLIDVTEIIRDTILAGQPMKNLCREDCKGLCPVCGKNLNDGECGCDRFIVDPRLAPLEILKNF